MFQWSFLTLVATAVAAGDLVRRAPPAFAYPDYCAKIPLAPSARQPPSLAEQDRQKHLELAQVQVIIRHGARTPAAYNTCWKGYKPKWNCELIEAARAELHDARTFVFDKVYDASPDDNVFGGTCQKGQLLSEGAAQHASIGQFLAESYILDTPVKVLGPDSPPLIADLEEIRDAIYIRSTDSQRTRLSASSLLTSLLRSAFPNAPTTGVQMPSMHTMDLERDNLFINAVRCPRIAALSAEILLSPKFKAIQERHLDLVNKWQRITGIEMNGELNPDTTMDCLMSYLCADQWDAFPDEVNPNGTNPEGSAQLVADMIEAIDEEMAFLHLDRNSEYSRLSISPLVQSIRHHIAAIDTEDFVSNENPKLFLWSGHDTTLLPFLAAFGGDLWNRKWTPYASAIILEVFKDDMNHDYLFRLIFNGDVLTSKVNGCSEDLCSISHFFNATSWADTMVHKCEQVEGSESRSYGTRPAGPNMQPQGQQTHWWNSWSSVV